MFTGVPVSTVSPPLGSWEMTVPAGAPSLTVVVFPTARPAPVISFLASASVIPTTFGTVTRSTSPM